MTWIASLITYEKYNERYTGRHKYAAVFFDSQSKSRMVRSSRRIHSTVSSALDYAKRFNLRSQRRTCHEDQTPDQSRQADLTRLS